MAIEARIPTIATTIISSINVKAAPELRRSLWLVSNATKEELLDVVDDVEARTARHVELRIDRTNALVSRVHGVAVQVAVRIGIEVRTGVRAARGVVVA